MKKLIRFFGISMFVLCLVACTSNETKSNTTTFMTTLTGSNEVPSNMSTATGNATLIFNNATKIFTITVNHTVVSPTMGHIHKGAMGVSGGVIFPFTNPASPITYTSMALTTDQEADLMANLYYVNIHSAAFPGGEIRGQLIKK